MRPKTFKNRLTVLKTLNSDLTRSLLYLNLLEFEISAMPVRSGQNNSWKKTVGFES